MILVTVLAIAACAVLYRMGGAAGYNTKFRDLGVPTVATAYLYYLGVHNPIALFLHFGLLFVSLTTYWDFVTGKDNFWLHGFFCALSAITIAVVTQHWWLFLIRCLVIAVWSGVWSLLWKWDVAEESGRLLPLVPTFLMIS